MHSDKQIKYYDNIIHENLLYSDQDTYGRNLLTYLVNFANINKQDKVLELGAGAGRFSIHLISAGFDVTCLDFSKTQLEKLRESCEKADISCDKIKVRCASIENAVTELNEQYDIIIGFFVLHHLDTKNLESYFSEFRKLLKPNGKICFLEPNRLNPLYFFQVLFQKDMTFECEIGMWKLSKGLLKKELLSSQYSNVHFKTFGFFPPQILNRFPLLLKLEKIFEKIPIVNLFLPFLLVTAYATDYKTSTEPIGNLPRKMKGVYSL